MLFLWGFSPIKFFEILFLLKALTKEESLQKLKIHAHTHITEKKNIFFSVVLKGLMKKHFSSILLEF